MANTTFSGPVRAGTIVDTTGTTLGTNVKNIGQFPTFVVTPLSATTLNVSDILLLSGFIIMNSRVCVCFPMLASVTEALEPCAATAIFVDAVFP